MANEEVSRSNDSYRDRNREDVLRQYREEVRRFFQESGWDIELGAEEPDRYLSVELSVPESIECRGGECRSKQGDVVGIVRLQNVSNRRILLGSPTENQIAVELCIASLPRRLGRGASTSDVERLRLNLGQYLSQGEGEEAYSLTPETVVEIRFDPTRIMNLGLLQADTFALRAELTSTMDCPVDAPNGETGPLIWCGRSAVSGTVLASLSEPHW